MCIRDRIISKCNPRHSIGKLHEALGFKEKGFEVPEMFSVIPEKDGKFVKVSLNLPRKSLRYLFEITKDDWQPTVQEELKAKGVPLFVDAGKVLYELDL